MNDELEQELERLGHVGLWDRVDELRRSVTMLEDEQTPAGMIVQIHTLERYRVWVTKVKVWGPSN